MIKILFFATFLLINKCQSLPIPQANLVQYYDPYYQYYQWYPYQYYQNNGIELQSNSQYPVHLSSESNSNSYEDDNKNIFENIFESIFIPTTKPTTSTERTTTSPPATTTRITSSTSVAEGLVQRDCVEKCIERPPSQYDPVCGSNGETYYNSGRLSCAIDCGVDVTQARRGTCTPMVSMIVSGMANQTQTN